ncbi:hypothetical protein MJO28_000301 [Puccinia striiformis f. sp. tritici]|uniref:Uncharacterized protein n=1 Tax=Puccinia striiformis f. sp. tritici TaxID=168172 RepID=A0ACC0EXR4_9BASI|nr:hypothetical protein Pst134EA_000927 [Puccinia striiformis f. sp. tritici]KAH9473865.1 hypothetical protein Pst134EA_000927 [Puccinia striiformis f. sp. tritici]KAI7962207.1 hypothetical protein MJO28_000301 [Puccinia striiformis f. sp. tritici]KAI7967646.1 hypothetical protein MJO29_000923 [Puccinia striiformis f. sp. tritici]
MCYTSQQFAPHPVPIIYASAPILKPKPIRPTINTNVQPASFNRPLPQPKPLRRPSLLRASTLDGRSLTEVINAARRASLNEQPKRTTKSPISINEGYPSNPHSRRMSFDEPPPSFGHSDHSHHSHHHHHYPRLPSDASRNDPYFPDPYSYDLK